MNGFSYDGNWENNKPNGYGAETYSDGSRYDGEFMDGLKHGKGNFHWNDGRKYVGEFREGYMHGKGLLTKGNGVFDGYFERNEKVEGQMTTEFGRYKGKFVRGMMEDEHGLFEWNDGKVYEGPFRANKLHGKGKITFKGGQVAEGEWIDG